ncbi:MAG: hypothetical protein JXA71_14190, partial [Chitinispirillaceae bacterium]|nr:hypothetical protein [Chitinispirillaceae bacterium]
MRREVSAGRGLFRLAAGMMLQLSFVLTAMSAEHKSDSLAYVKLIQSVEVSENNRSIIETAEALAQEGLYAEAVELVGDLLPKADTGAVSDATVAKTPWRIAFGTDFYHIEDVDTALLTAEELRDYNRLIETPLSLWSRVRLDHKCNENGLVQGIAPELYASERKAVITVPLRMAMAAERLLVEGAVGAAKWFRADASGNTPFEPAKAQPSDMGKTSLCLINRSLSSPEKNFFWRVPVALSWEHFRKNRTGYESCVEYGFSPAAEWRAGGPLAGVRALLDCRYQDYYNDGADSLDVARLLGRIDGDLRLGQGSFMPALALFADRYTAHERLQEVDRIDCSLRSEYPLHGCVNARLSGRFVYEREAYRIINGTHGFFLDGSETTVRPSLRVSFGTLATIEPELSAELRAAHERDTPDSSTVRRYLWEARRSLEPALR